MLKSNPARRGTAALRRRRIAMPKITLALTLLTIGYAATAADSVKFIEQNFDKLKTGVLLPNWNGKRPGGWKVYNQQNFYVVNKPAFSAPHSLKVCRESGGAALFFRDDPVPENRDVTVSFMLYLPREKGVFGLWFTDGTNNPIGGMLLEPGKGLRGYTPQPTQRFVWTPTSGTDVPVDRFFRVEVRFRAADRQYSIVIDDNGKKTESRDYPFLNTQPLKVVQVLTCQAEGSCAYMDDLLVSYDRNPSKPRTKAESDSPAKN